MDSPSKKRPKQQQFQQKLNQIVKLIKQKQQITLDLISYLQQIINNKSQLQQLFFLQDQISKHKFFIQKLHKKFQQIQQTEKCIFTTFCNHTQLNQHQKSLIKRVSARVLEIFQSYNQKAQKYPHFQKQISLHYRITKPKIIKLINNIDKPDSTLTNLNQLCTVCFQYLNNKFCDQQTKLFIIIQFIQNGDLDKIQQAYTCQHCKQFQTLNEIKYHSKNIEDKREIKDKMSVQSMENYQSKYFSKEKEKIKEKLKGLRLQAKNKQTIKKKKTKFANKYYSLYQSAMDIHKGYFVDELVFYDQKQQQKRLLQQIKNRNKCNQSFINTFLHVSSQRYRGVKDKKVNFQETTLSLSIVANQQSYDENSNIDKKQQRQKLQRVNSIDIQLYEDNYVPIDQTDNIKQMVMITEQRFYQCQERNQSKSFRITNGNNKKNIAPTPKSNPNLFAIKQSQSFNFIKISMKNPTSNQRSRLPDISNRLFSIDDRRKSIKIISKQPPHPTSTNNLLMVKTGINRKPQIKKLEEKSKTGQITRISSKYKNLKRSQSGNKLQPQKNDRNCGKTLQINYSTSISKKLNKFCQIVSKKECAY